MRTRNASLLATALCCAATSALATEYGTVISSTPVYSSAPVAQRLCRDEVVETERRGSSGGGALVGALFGAVLGNSLGQGSGRAVATGIGMVAGAAIGDQIEARESGRSTATVQRCRTVSQQDQQVIAYDVVYDYNGVRRSVRLAQDPGDRIAVDVVPSGAAVRGREGAPNSAPRYAPRDPYPDSAPVYRSPADRPYDVDDEAAPSARYAPRGVVYAPAPVLYVNPLPAIYIGGSYRYGGHRHPGWRGHRYPR